MSSLQLLCVCASLCGSLSSELGLNVTAEEEELEKHLRNKRLIENKIIPELKRRDAANKTTVMNPLHPGSASASTDNVDSMTKL